MAKVDITALNERTRQKIYPNDVEAITGQVLQDQLVDMNSTLAAGINDNDITTMDNVRRLGVIEQKQKEDGLKIDALDKEMGQVKGDLAAEVQRATAAEEANAQAIATNSGEISTIKQKQAEDGEKIDSLDKEMGQVKKSVSDEIARATAAEDALGKRIDNTYTKAETDEKIEAVAGSVYKSKGSVQDAAALLALQGVKVGDTYNVIDAGTIDGKPFLAGTNFVATIAGAGDQPNMWDPLGGTIDTTDFLKKTEAAEIYATKANLDKEVKQAEAGFANLTQNLAAEESRATKAEKANADNITAETTRATEAEKVNADAIAAEQKRAEAAEAELAGGGALRPLYLQVPDVSYNSDTKKYELYKYRGGLTDVTEGQMAHIYSESYTLMYPNVYPILYSLNSRALIPRTSQIMIEFEGRKFLRIGYCRMEFFEIRLAGDTRWAVQYFDNCRNIVALPGRVCIGDKKTNFDTCDKLKTISFNVDKTISKTELVIKNCPSLSFDTYKTIPSGTTGTTYSNTTTVTVDALPYSLLTGTATPEQYTATGHTKEEWAQIVTDSTAKGITYTQALERSEATRFRRSLPEPTRVEGGEIIAATDKALHREGSDAYFDRATLLEGETAADFVEIDREEALAIIEAKEAEEAAKYQPMEGAAE